jgi:hypothetical protein
MPRIKAEGRLSRPTFEERATQAAKDLEPGLAIASGPRKGWPLEESPPDGDRFTNAGMADVTGIKAARIIA